MPFNISKRAPHERPAVFMGVISIVLVFLFGLYCYAFVTLVPVCSNCSGFVFLLTLLFVGFIGVLVAWAGWSFLPKYLAQYGKSTWRRVCLATACRAHSWCLRCSTQNRCRATNFRGAARPRLHAACSYPWRWW